MFTVIKKLLFSILLIFLLTGCATNKLVDIEIEEPKEESQTLILEFTYGWEYYVKEVFTIIFKPKAIV
jgi:hypothetical protein